MVKYFLVILALLFNSMLIKAQVPQYTNRYMGTHPFPIFYQHPLYDTTFFDGVQNIGRRSHIFPALSNTPVNIKRFYIETKSSAISVGITGLTVKLGHTNLDYYGVSNVNDTAINWLPTDTVFVADTFNIIYNAINSLRWTKIDLTVPFTFDSTGNLVWEIRREGILGGAIIQTCPDYTYYSAPVTETILFGNPPYTTGTKYVSQYSYMFGFDLDGVHDAALTGFVKPDDSLCSDINPIKVKVHNPGIPIMDSVRIHWTANNVPQTTFYYTTPIGGGETDTVQIGFYNFPNGVPVTIKAWTSHPNGLLDIFNTNDTIQKTFTATKDFVSNFTVNAGNDTAICAGDTITLSAGSGTSTVVSFLWDDNSTNQTRQISTGGTYYVTVSDSNSCERYDTVIVTSNPIPIVDLGNDTTICPGNTVIFDAGNPGLNYLWDDNSTNQLRYASNAQSYYVAVSDNIGCTGSDTVVLHHFPLPSGQINITHLQGLTYDFMIANPINVTEANWHFGDGNTANGMWVQHTYNALGTYNVLVSMSGVCMEVTGMDEKEFTLNDTTTNNLGNIDYNKGIAVSPNPFGKGFTIKIEQDKGETYILKITDILGRTILETKGTIQQLNTQLQTEPKKWQSGQYILQLMNINIGNLKTVKIVSTKK